MLYFIGGYFIFHQQSNNIQSNPSQKTGQPFTMTPFAVGQEAKGQSLSCMLLPHQLRAIFSDPKHRYKSTPMKARPTSRAPEST